MAKEWLDPLEVEPPKNVLVEVLGIPNATPKKAQVEFEDWRIAAFMDAGGVWRIPEVEMGNYMLLERIFFNEVYRWRDLIP